MSLQPDQIPDDDLFLLRYLPGQSPAMARLRAQIALLNQNLNRNLIRKVLLVGESGAGKNWTGSVIAAHRQWLYERERTGTDTFPASLDIYRTKYAEVNLPGLPDQLIESELFGHRRGAFTGADKDREGYLGQDYDDILLDEIGEVSMPIQAKLLRVLSGGWFRPIGGSPEDESRTDARLIMATNRDLPAMRAAGTFREDLLWRIGEFVIEVPPLREQADAVWQIASNIISELYDIRNLATGDLPALSGLDAAFARGYVWPGNVRQLRHALTRWLVYQGQQSLESCAVSLERELVSRPHPRPADLQSRVFTALDDALARQHPAATTVTSFVDEAFTDPARRAVVAWLDSRSPRPDVLEAIFPGHKNANSIRSTVNKWRATR